MGQIRGFTGSHEVPGSLWGQVWGFWVTVGTGLGFLGHCGDRFGVFGSLWGQVWGSRVPWGQVWGSGAVPPPQPRAVPRVTMVTPAVLRLDTDERVVLEAPGLSAATEASLLVQDFPQKRQVLFQSRLALSPAEGMMATATIKVSAKLLPPAQKKQFVTVTARVAAVTLEKVLLVSLQSGHIFLQTDKPIYTPGATVLCRLFTVGHLMQPVAKTVIVEVKVGDSG
ncbi:complement C3-like isoform X3 [Cyanistes caeruleus]|uniref:complement C3-like isoform X3 n=1 Tax=Cyanistes caeruleus TaxID=156563 RepID=UPI000CDB1439|nr:complement C3-like isoform X3 [Cyanistes caeruleus]